MGRLREKGSVGSGFWQALNTVNASGQVRAKMETQSNERQAGTTPVILSRPRLGFKPTVLVNPAGTLPDPTTADSSSAVPMNSARHRRLSDGTYRFSVRAVVAGDAMTPAGTQQPVFASSRAKSFLAPGNPAALCSTAAITA